MCDRTDKRGTRACGWREAPAPKPLGAWHAQAGRAGRHPAGGRVRAGTARVGATDAVRAERLLVVESLAAAPRATRPTLMQFAQKGCWAETVQPFVEFCLAEGTLGSRNAGACPSRLGGRAREGRGQRTGRSDTGRTAVGRAGSFLLVPVLRTSTTGRTISVVRVFLARGFRMIRGSPPSACKHRRCRQRRRRIGPHDDSAALRGT